MTELHLCSQGKHVQVDNYLLQQLDSSTTTMETAKKQTDFGLSCKGRFLALDMALSRTQWYQKV
jgi:hypothetical protein